MSSRTKSFFDQNHNNKQRHAQWHRNQSKAPLSEKSNNASPPKPPIPATAETKSKLKAFQFIPGHPSAQERIIDKENERASNEGDKADVEQQFAPSDAGVSKSNNESSAPLEYKVTSAPQQQDVQTFPSTPGTRLPLEDLIGNSDENAKRAEPERTSPEEHIGWIPNSSSNLLTPSRKRKRARSSSPSCPNTSQQQETSVFFAATTAHGDQQALDADPSVDLWQRYGAEKQTGGELKLPDFSHLMFEASPRSHETPAKGAGLRRWASTGNDWPTSKNKRRRTCGKTNTNLWQHEQTAESGEKSKFVDMLKKVEESLASQKLARQQSKPAVRIEGPSSSSPLPEIGAPDGFNKPPAASPLQTKQSYVPPKAVEPQRHRDIPKVANGTARQPLADNKTTTSYSDNRSAPAVDSVISAPLCLQSKARLPAYKRPSITRTPSDSAQQRKQVQTVTSANPVVTEDLDEFGDDLELTAEDLDELMSQPPPLDQRPLHQIPQHPDPPPQQAFSNEESNGAALLENVSAGCAAQPIDVQDNDDDDEFGMDDIDEASFTVAEISATQALRISPGKRSPIKSKFKTPSPRALSYLHATSELKRPLKHLQRYVVKQIVEGEYTNAKGRHCPEKLLLAEEYGTSRTTAITIRDSWASTSISPGNIVHVAHVPQPSSIEPLSSPPGQITISDIDCSPLLIVHPDHMLSATTVADSFDCIRKAVLQDRIKATGETSKSMVYGKILHEIFQQALSANLWDDAFLAELVERTVLSHVESLWELGMKDSVLAIEEIKAKMGELASWARIFVAEIPSEVAIVDDKQGEKMWMSISKLIAVEEHVWSPRYGLKGNIDATVQATLVNHPREPAKKLIAPFEVKTGRTTQSPAHRAQTALYTLLLSDRYDVNVEAGVLYYLESSAMSRIAPPINEIRQMIQQRNRLATYLHRAKNPSVSETAQDSRPQTQEIEESGLPALLKNAFKCSKCYAQKSCFAYHALVESGSADSAGMVDDGKKNYSLVWQEAVGHLQLSARDRSQADRLKQWFTKWDRLLTFEESESSKFRRELWTMDSAKREAAGRCFGDLVIPQDLTSTAASVTPSLVDGIEGSGGKIHRFAYTFAKRNRQPEHSFAQGTQLTVGEPVVVSSEIGQWALANGYVIAATKLDITVAVDRRLGAARERYEDFDDERNQAFRGVMTVGPDSTTTCSSKEFTVLYRLDKDEFSNGLALIRNNLVTLMSSHPIHTKLREQIILYTEPGFTTSSVARQLAPSQLGEMNEDQRAAVDKVLNAKDYALILGMPGTGKTTTIAHIIRAFLAEEKSILLTSFTHTAVDNILLKIRGLAPPNSILRIGAPAKINSQVQEFCRLAATPGKTIEDVEDVYMGCRIVAATCMGTNHSLFNRRAFDVCIVDEASQITLPTSLGPLLHARRFVLVGDHYQLPPLVQNKAALEGGLDVSLFRQLSEEQPGAVATLGKQYRMCEDIMSLANALIYGGQLRCGNEMVAHRTLQTGGLNELSAFHSRSAACTTPSRGSRCWLEDLVQPHRKVVFANTDAAGNIATETLTLGKNITNVFEATLVAQLVLSLQALGVSSSDIGVMALYRSQLALLKQLFKRAGISNEVEIDSADRFQGRDKECIILSMVRSNEAGVVGDLLKDWRRVNVAFTRARSKLIILGSRKTLHNNDLLANFLKIVQDRAWTVELPKDADGCHTFNFSSQAASEVLAESTLSPNKDKWNSIPSKPESVHDTLQTLGVSPRAVLKDSLQGINQSPLKRRKPTDPPKIISGKAARGTNKSRKAMEQAAFEIFEDINADDS